MSLAVDSTSQCLATGVCQCGSGAYGVDCSIPSNILTQCSAIAVRISFGSFVNYVYTKSSSSEMDVLINIREDSYYINTAIYVSTIGFPNSVNPTQYNWTSTQDSNTVRISNLTSSIQLYITVTNWRVSYTDAYVMAFELPYNDEMIPITNLGQTMHGCSAISLNNTVPGQPETVQTANLYTYYYLLRSTVDSNIVSGSDPSTAIVRFDLVGFNNNVNAYLLQINSGMSSTIKPTNMAVS